MAMMMMMMMMMKTMLIVFCSRMQNCAEIGKIRNAMRWTIHQKTNAARKIHRYMNVSTGDTGSTISILSMITKQSTIRK